MNKETIFEIHDFDDPFEIEKFESLPKDILVELLVRHLKREIKAIEKYLNCKEEDYCTLALDMYDILRGKDE